jgi:hypothetical protein
VEDSEAILRAAEGIVDLLRKEGIETVIIGAVALAAYHYVRQTEDIDLGVNTDLPSLRRALDSIVKAGFTAELREPDPEDPLGGVIDVSGSFGVLQIINFGGRFPAVIDDAVRLSNFAVRDGSLLKLVPLPQLIALKLYAGGHKSKADIVELLTRNPDLDLDETRAVCRRYRLPGLEELIREAQST